MGFLRRTLAAAGENLAQVNGAFFLPRTKKKEECGGFYFKTTTKAPRAKGSASVTKEVLPFVKEVNNITSAVNYFLFKTSKKKQARRESSGLNLGLNQD